MDTPDARAPGVEASEPATRTLDAGQASVASDPGPPQSWSRHAPRVVVGPSGLRVVDPYGEVPPRASAMSIWLPLAIVGVASAVVAWAVWFR